MNPNDYLVLFICLAAAVVAASWVVARQLSASRQARAELTAGEQYRGLADEYRRLSDTAITAQEHLDLRLTDLSVRIDELRDKMEQMQRILKEVE
jgi:TolA-binding protein